MQKEIINIINNVLSHYPVKSASIFGSYARGDFNEKSDVDILIEYKEPMSMMLFMKMKYELEDALKKNVDVVTYSALKYFLKQKILAEQQIIYNA